MVPIQDSKIISHKNLITATQLIQNTSKWKVNWRIKMPQMTLAKLLPSRNISLPIHPESKNLTKVYTFIILVPSLKNIKA